MTTAFEYIVSSETARMEFFHYYETELGRDGGQVLISVDGDEWSVITPEGDYPDQTVEAFRNNPGYTGRMANWTMAQFDLADYENSVIKIRFRFASDESLNNYDGWHIDDLVFWGCEIPDYATISGVITDQEGEPAAELSVSDGRQTTSTNDDGEFSLNEVLAGEVMVTVQSPGYNSVEQELNIEAGDDINLDMSIIHAEVSVDPENFEFELGGNDHLTVDLEIDNETEIDLPYWLRITSTPEQMRDNDRLRSVRAIGGEDLDRDDPWDISFNINLTENTGQSRIMGAEFAAGNFYITSADPEFGPMISILDWQGNLIQNFEQPIDVIGWGLRDLAYDGELLYGSQGDIIYGITVEGELTDEIDGAPITVNRALAYDPAADGFWTGEWDSPWFFVDRDGQAELIWEGHGLEGVYGFAYHQNDADGMPLYVLNLNDDGNTEIYRANPAEEEIEMVHELNNAPTGCFLTGGWDENRWILGAISGTDTQHLMGFEIGPRISWLTVDPPSGEIEAGGMEQFSIDVHVPIDAEENDVYEGEISIRIFGANIVLIPIEATITDEFQHFDSPQESDIIHTIEIESATFQGSSLSIGSEIAAFTPRDEVAGVMRWLDHPDQFPAYQGEGAFNRDETIDFRVWVSDIDRVFEPTIEVIDGIERFNGGETSTFALSITLPDTQTVELVNGWNLVSVYIQPDPSGVADILGDINERGNLVIAKDGSGRFWWPAMNFNGLGDWDILGGYQVNVSEAESFTVVGDRVAPDTEIHLDRGWNAISYLFDHEVDSRIAFAGIMDDIRIVKNGDGQFMVPDVNFFGLGPLIPGQGYKVKMHRNADLVYNDQNEDDDGERINSVSVGNILNTGSDMSLIIDDIQGVDQSQSIILNVYSQNSKLLIGNAEVNYLPMGMVLHGDDITTDILDGAKEDEQFRFELIESSTRLNTEPKLLDGQLKYITDGFTRVQLAALSQIVPSSFTMSDVYPNPFNEATVIRFSVPHEMELNLIVRDIAGRDIYSLPAGKYAAGWHEVSINSANWSSGIYFMDIQADDQIHTRKLVLLK